MSMPAPTQTPLNPDTTFVTVKVAIDGTNRRFKLALRDLGANVFPTKLRFLLAIPPETDVTFERYSDSAASYVTLDSNNPAVYKQLYRAAKAKSKLRIKATVSENTPKTPEVKEAETIPIRSRSNYLETVLDQAPETAQPTFVSAKSLMDTSLPNFTTETLVESTPKVEESKSIASSVVSRSSPVFHNFPSGIFCIDCNYCGSSIPNEHYHCSICDDGDFDLCMDCVDHDVHCNGDGHWLIKRTLQNGRVINSTTKTIAPKKEKTSIPAPESAPEPAPEPASEPEATTPIAPVAPVPQVRDYIVERTCNSCIGEFPNSEFVSCLECYDYDLCENCLIGGQHGHNPAHHFYSLEKSSPDPLITALCSPGRNVTHLAICDGCDKSIVGVRHKCLNCPDWDYCSECIDGASRNHPGHRFAPLYEPIADVNSTPEVHYGIHCDGVLCENKARRSYIRGVRYKCAVCNDTDFCANCEAHPSNYHNRTHPLIMFKTSVKHVTVSTTGEHPNGKKMTPMGDLVPKLTLPSPIIPKTKIEPAVPRPVKSAATETVPVAKSANAATQVQTMADFKPVPSEPVAPVVEKKAAIMDARFVSDAVPDGSVLAPNSTFTQVWTMVNPGPDAWPAGCSVRFVGGDWMLNMDTEHPSSVSAIYAATESTVTEAPVMAGESFDFKIVLKTPAKEGRVISYWRLKSADGTPFGHKLWCDVSVRHRPVKVDDLLSTSTPSIKAEKKEEPVKSEDSSIMIFPKLEKESPDSSIHETAKSQTSEVPIAQQNPATYDDLFQDEESAVEAGEFEDDETDDGFLTDEEYDILDASDEEFLDAAQKAVE